ncbi:alpha-amylase family glycosyl hydrolase [Actinomyces sp. B33]|uniref:alpha-amylase family glycosyl hydrolase n=1 Tax=Actinomyces sp. B33 TaxID=2942131 RepID=UPI0023402208|nr:alpha-amylase family glycosyl hydrolase [Actinomyces sp. B33]MDC4232342.1 alpha-amylase family glycosyl hydrolase [Actinomyces sp. B33]
METVTGGAPPAPRRGEPREAEVRLPSPARSGPDGAGAPWWRGAVVYQVYVRSFRDADGDGIGDLAGVRAGLDDLARLGVDAIWLNPCYPSPQRDHGYDIADYRDVDPVYGTLADLDALIADAHARGIRVVMDIVPNHCSDRHPWFRAAVAADPGSDARSRFLFVDSDGSDEPPNAWTSVFGGSAWTRVPDGSADPQWYFHAFDSSQPDFDWSAEDVRAGFDDILRFWFDRGVDGFRIDVAHGLVKRTPLPIDDPSQDGLWRQGGVVDVYRRWRRIGDSYRGSDGGDEPRYFIGEAWADDPAFLRSITAPDALHQSFAFALLIQPWFAHRLRAAIDASLAAAGPEGPAWALSNHDVHRLATRLGQERIDRDFDPLDMLSGARRTGPVDPDLGLRRARAAAALLLALPGTVYLYQGDELGLFEVLDLPDGARQDPIWRRTGGRELGRDGCRVPLPWTADGPSMGFGPDDGAAPWLPQPEDYRGHARDRAENDPASILALHRRLIALRRDLVGSADGLEWIDPAPPGVLAFAVGGLVCATNTEGADAAWRPPAGARLVLSTCDGAEPGVVPGDSTTWYALDA